MIRCDDLCRLSPNASPYEEAGCCIQGCRFDCLILKKNGDDGDHGDVPQVGMWASRILVEVRS